MKQLIYEPDILSFENIDEFFNEIKLTQNDLVFTSERTAKRFFPDAKCLLITRGKYGSGEPTDEMMENIISDIKDINYDRVIGIGGGAILDMAKIIACLDEKTIDEMYENTASIKKNHELYLVPTTCGTGSEVTNISVLNRLEIGTKMGLVSDEMFCDKAVLIPELLDGIPFNIFASSSMDALTHAIESYLSPLATDLTKVFGQKAIELILKGYIKIRDKGRGVLDSRLYEDFLFASTYAGLSFGTAGCGTVHAMAYPLGGNYHVSHGESNAVILLGVLKFYAHAGIKGNFKELLTYMAGILSCEPIQALHELEKLTDSILPAKPLREYGMKEEETREFAENVMKTQQRLLGRSFVEMDEDKLEEIYRSLY